MSDYGSAIQKLRKRNNMTQSELGEKLNVSSQAVSKWENGLSQPDVDTIRRITTLFSISMDDFIKIVDNTEINENACDETAATVSSCSPSKIIGFCTSCGKTITDESEISSQKPKIVCKDCFNAEKAKNERAAREKQYKENEIISRNKSKFTKSFVIPAVIIVLLLLIFIPCSFTVKPLKPIYSLYASIFAVLLYLAILQIIWDDGPVPAIFAALFKKTFSMPGVIFEWSVDGVIWLICVKIVLAIFAFILSLLCSVFCILLCCLIAPFSFIPVLCNVIKEVEQPSPF